MPSQPFDRSIEETLKKPSPFVTGLEKHYTDQVLNNKMSSDQARQELDEVRRSRDTMNHLVKKKLKTNNNPPDQPDSQSSNSLLNDERLKGIEPAMIELIQGEIISNLESTSWAKIAGLEYAKSKIQQIAILPLKRPDLFTGIRSPPKGMLVNSL